MTLDAKRPKSPAPGMAAGNNASSSTLNGSAAPNMARGMLTRADLESKIAMGEIDTIIMGVTDIYGRLCGKRLDADYFLRQVSTSACNYLFACDMDMNPIPGFKKYRWVQGSRRTNWGNASAHTRTRARTQGHCV